MPDQHWTCKNCGNSWGTASIPSEGTAIYHETDSCNLCGLRPSQRLIPVRKIQHLRFGQLIFCALSFADRHPELPEVRRCSLDALFYMENDELEKIIQEFLAADKEED